MTLYDLIHKDDELTDNEYRLLYNFLVMDNLIKIPFNKGFIDKMVKRLKYPSKSYRSLFNFCQRKFDLQRIKNIKINKFNSFASVSGRNAHMVFDKVWNKINYIHVINSKSQLQLAKYIYKLCNSYIPIIEKNTKIERSYNAIFWNYACYEAYRIYTYVFDILGRTNVKRYIFPLYRELKIENYNIDEVGVIDVVHLLYDDTHAIGDYKTGKPKYYNEQYGKEAIDFELGHYLNLLLDIDNVYKIEYSKAKCMEMLRVKHGFVVYVLDWYNTFRYIKLDINMLEGINKLSEKIIESINKHTFELRADDTCFEFCEYIDICLNDIRFKNRYSGLLLEIKNTLDNIFLPVEDIK